MDDEGFILDSFTLWDSLHSLAVEIPPKIEISLDSALSIYDAVEEIHQSAERFKQEWLNSYKNNPENYPLELPADNIGLFTEQFSMSLGE